jgi:hypothetical protein
MFSSRFAAGNDRPNNIGNNSELVNPAIDGTVRVLVKFAHIIFLTKQQQQQQQQQ